MGFWNVRTMNQLSKTEQVLKEMRQYLIDILVLSEIRWTGNGLEKFSDGYVMAYSGHPSVHRAGVGLLMSPLAHKAMTNWNPVNERIMTARFVSNHTKMTIIACYAPTNEADEEEKDAFYNMLHSVTKDVPRHDVLCVVGDLNAKVGADRQYCPEVLGPHGMGEINENGTLLIDYALSNDLLLSAFYVLWSNILCSTIKRFTSTHGCPPTAERRIKLTISSCQDFGEVAYVT
ncbi:craniofacial development protein 2-like [Artemia franciscana]|uniref:craniofacial development protein 2-like n=1 Tax=Artemia franciscana TaxID=6661 RepID=UPI0032DB5D46